MSLTLSEIFIYPIKSLGGISVSEALVMKAGLQFDRRMMLVDENGIFITQRNYPQMALLKTEIINGQLIIRHLKSDQSISIPLVNDDNFSSEKVKVIIWNDQCEAILAGKEYDEFFSDSIGIRCRLVYMPASVKRIVDPEKKYVSDEHSVSFADGYPFLIIGQSSLDELNNKLENPLPINRFRPNFVFTGGRPFEEDDWREFLINEIKFKAVKPCARCVITTTDQQTAERSDEPLRTLAKFRRAGNKVLFGMNLVTYGIGRIKVGDSIILL